MNHPDWADHERWLASQTTELLDFGRASAEAPNGFAWLDAAGRPELDRPLDLWVTARMTHVYSLGALIGHPGAEALADHGLAALTGPFADPEGGGWHTQLAPDGTATDSGKEAYAHSFVVLAGSSAVTAGRPGAEQLLTRALANQNSRFLRAGDGMVIDRFNRDFTRADPYRGANANMHTVEAYLAAADATGETTWRRRALGIIERMVKAAREHSWRLPEHFTADWRPILGYNADHPKDRFRPYGATPGHGFEWSRLIWQTRAALGAAAPDWMEPAAEELFRRARGDGWRDTPTPGFVYTVDWDGRTVIEARLYWVLAEAVSAAITGYRVTGDPFYRELYDRWWTVIEERFIDRELGSWHHELTASGAVGETLWDGKPDIYHTVQATLIPRLPVGPTLARALEAGLLDRA